MLMPHSESTLSKVFFKGFIKGFIKVKVLAIQRLDVFKLIIILRLIWTEVLQYLIMEQWLQKSTLRQTSLFEI